MAGIMSIALSLSRRIRLTNKSVKVNLFPNGAYHYMYAGRNGICVENAH